MTPSMPRTRAIYTREKIMRPNTADWLLVLAFSSWWWIVGLLWATTP